MKTNKTTIFGLLFICLTTLSSCKLDRIINVGEKGDGNVISEERDITNFNKIKVSHAIKAIVTIGNKPKVRVVTDENLQKLLITKVENGTLKVFFDGNVQNSSQQTVYINTKSLIGISTSSAANVEVKNTIKTEDLKLKSSSASSIYATVNTKNLHCNSSSASIINVSGQSDYLACDASSASTINAKKLKSVKTDVEASSAANVDTNTIEDLKAKASSGGDVDDFGNPESVDKNTSSGGSVSSKSKG